MPSKNANYEGYFLSGKYHGEGKFIFTEKLIEIEG